MGGEIDIIAFDTEKNEIVFIEVKTRSNLHYGLPADAVDNRKMNNILKGVKKYLHFHKLENKFIRFDVIELFFKNQKFYINHIKQVI